MNWHELAMNPEAITQLYRVPPALTGLQVTELNLHRDGPRMSLSALLPQFPDNPPRRWVRDGCNVAAIQLDFLGLGDLELAGWATENLADLELTSGPDQRITIRARWASGRLDATCDAFRIAHLTAHVAGA